MAAETAASTICLRVKSQRLNIAQNTINGSGKMVRPKYTLYGSTAKTSAARTPAILPKRITVAADAAIVIARSHISTDSAGNDRAINAAIVWYNGNSTIRH